MPEGHSRSVTILKSNAKKDNDSFGLGYSTLGSAKLSMLQYHRLYITILNSNAQDRNDKSEHVWYSS